MNITFLIGNGFDIALGLRTRFSDFIKEYTENDSNDHDIEMFKTVLPNWSNVELEFGKHTADYTDIDVLKFRKLLLDFSEQFSKYLISEESRIDLVSCCNRITSSVLVGLFMFYNFMRPIQTNTILGVYKLYSNEQYIYNFINFNYTYLLDNCVKLVNDSFLQHHASNGSTVTDKVAQILHIHGTYDKDMLLGVNDKSQILNESFRGIPKLVNLFVKPQANNFLKTGIDEKCEEIIYKSRILVVFGMSLGETDSKWWTRIIGYLENDLQRHLVIFIFNSNCNRVLPDLYVDCVEDTLNLLKKYGLSDALRPKLESRIHIILEDKLLGDPLI